MGKSLASERFHTGGVRVFVSWQEKVMSALGSAGGAPGDSGTVADAVAEAAAAKAGADAKAQAEAAQTEAKAEAVNSAGGAPGDSEPWLMQLQRPPQGLNLRLPRRLLGLTQRRRLMQRRRLGR